MGWDDASQYRDGGRPLGGSILNLLNGSLPLGTVAGIRLRIHATLLVFVGVTLMLEFVEGYDLKHRALSMGALLGLLLLHELGHGMTARWLGGEAVEIVLWPLGGLAAAEPPNRPGPTFLTAAAGPLLNAAVCASCLGGLWLAQGRLVAPWHPFHLLPPAEYSFDGISVYLWWIFAISYVLLLFNLLPIYPLDGGRMLQAGLWPSLGYYRSSNAACVAGMCAAVLLGLGGLFALNFFLIATAIFGFAASYQQRAVLRDMGPPEFQDAVAHSASLFDRDAHRRRRLTRRALRRARKLARREQLEQNRIDMILAKVSAHGMQSLTWWERRTLHKATERQRQRDLELTQESR